MHIYIYIYIYTYIHIYIYIYTYGDPHVQMCPTLKAFKQQSRKPTQHVMSHELADPIVTTMVHSACRIWQYRTWYTMYTLWNTIMVPWYGAVMQSHAGNCKAMRINIGLSHYYLKLLTWSGTLQLRIYRARSNNHNFAHSEVKINECIHDNDMINLPILSFDIHFQDSANSRL